MRCQNPGCDNVVVMPLRQKQMNNAVMHLYLLQNTFTINMLHQIWLGDKIIAIVLPIISCPGSVTLLYHTEDVGRSSAWTFGCRKHRLIRIPELSVQILCPTCC